MNTAYDCLVCGKHYPSRNDAALHVSRVHTSGRIEPCPNDPRNLYVRPVAESRAETGGRIPCQGCGIPIPEPGEYPDPAALLCDTCYEDGLMRRDTYSTHQVRPPEGSRAEHDCAEYCDSTGCDFQDVRPVDDDKERD